MGTSCVRVCENNLTMGPADVSMFASPMLPKLASAPKDSGQQPVVG